MNQNIVIDFVSVSLSYKTESSRRTLKSALVNTIKNKEKIVGIDYQLREFTVSIAKGEQVGIVGRNGSGKSTFLKLVAGVLTPDLGEISVQGSITPLIDLGAGMHPDLSCKDNIYLSGAYLGLSRKEMEVHLSEIISWAEIEEVIDSPLHSLSTGTQSRLAFSIATSLTPEIVLVDEVLSVGDIRFQRKSRDRMDQLKAAGSAVLIVSHDLEYLSKSVKRIIWIKDGRLYKDGSTSDILSEYTSSFDE